MPRGRIGHRYLASGTETPQPPPPSGDTAPRRMIHMTGAWDDDITGAQQANFEAKIYMIVGFQGSPQWNVHKNWNLLSLDYHNTFSETNSSFAVYQNDSDGAPLWLPFNINPDGTYARRSMDLRSETYRAGFANTIRASLADGGEGMFFDDVNLAHTRMFKRTGGGTPLIDNDLQGSSYYENTSTGLTGWAALLGDFYKDVLNRVRTGIGGTAYPNAKFAFNPVRWDLAPARWTDPRWERVIDQCDWITMEHGFADSGLTAGAGSDTGTDFTLRSTLKFIDKVHSRSKGVITYARGDGAVPADTRRYEMAVYLSKYDPARDIIGIWQEGNAWPNYDAVFDTDIGDRLTFSDANVSGTEIVATFTGGEVRYTPVSRSSSVITVGGGSGGGGGGGGGGGPTYLQLMQADVPLAFWELDEASGNFQVASGGNIPLTAAAGAGSISYSQAGLKSGGNAVRFQNGARAFSTEAGLPAAYAQGLRLLGPFSIEFWINPTVPGAGFPWILRKGNGNGIGQYMVYMVGSNGNLAFKRDGQDRSLSPADMNTAETRHFVITYDDLPQEMRVYMNGALVQTFTSVVFAAASTDTSDFEIGTATGGDNTLDKVAIYLYALTATQVSSHWNAS